MNNRIFDTVIIGSGSAGLSSAIYASRAKLNFVVLEKNSMDLGQIADSERVDNYPALLGVSGYELANKMKAHAIALGSKFVENEVKFIQKNNEIYKIITINKEEYLTKTVIYCGGASPQKLNISGEEKFLGMGVSYCAVCDGAFFRDKVVAVVGGGDTALSDALLLSKIANKVYLIHRRNDFRANKTLQEKVKNTSNIEIILNATPKEIKGDKKVSSVVVEQNGNLEELKIDGIFVAVGYKPNSEILKNLAEIDQNGYVVADETGKTNQNGLFVAGDVRKKSLRQVVTAVSDGANCVYSVENYLTNI